MLPTPQPTSKRNGNVVINTGQGPCVPLKFLSGPITINPSGGGTHEPFVPSDPSMPPTFLDEYDYGIDWGTEYDYLYSTETTTTEEPTVQVPVVHHKQALACTKRKQSFCNGVQTTDGHACRWNLEQNTCTKGVSCDPFFVCGTYEQHECQSDLCRWDFIVDHCTSKYAPSEDDSCQGLEQSQCNGQQAEEGRICKWNLETHTCTSGYSCDSHFICPTYGHQTCDRELCQWMPRTSRCESKFNQRSHHRLRSTHHQSSFILASFYDPEHHKSECDKYCSAHKLCYKCDVSLEFSTAKAASESFLQRYKPGLEMDMEKGVSRHPIAVVIAVSTLLLVSAWLCSSWYFKTYRRFNSQRNTPLLNV